MAYVRLPKVVIDYPVGVETINQADDNLQYIYDTYAAKHGSGATASGAWGKRGRHNDGVVPRSIIRLKWNAGVLDQYTVALLGPAYAGHTRITIGRVQVSVAGIANAYATCRPENSAAADARFASVRFQRNPNTSNTPSNVPPTVFDVTLFSLGGGIFDVEDMSFTLVVYGDPI